MRALLGAAELALIIRAEGREEGLTPLRREMRDAAGRALEQADEDELAVYRLEFLGGLSTTRACVEAAGRMSRSGFYRARRRLLEKVGREMLRG